MRLTDQQAEAVHWQDNLLLTACPGSGKTRTLTAKAVMEIEYLRDTPKKVLCITYTNSAAQEIEKRAGQQLAAGDEQRLYVSTIHSFCLNEILRPYGWLQPDFLGGLRVITRDNPDFEIIATYAAEQVNYFDISQADFEAFESLSVDANGRLVGLGAANAAVSRAAPYFWKRCASLGYVDFGQIIYNAYKILRDHPKIALSLTARFPWILVDEFQDTTELQIEILKLLYAAGRSKFFIVGDICQSIYGFTGARPELVAPFGVYIGAKTNLSLSWNFRSSARIVSHAERLFPRLPAMTAKGPNQNCTVDPIFIGNVTSFVAITEHFLPKIEEMNIPLGDATILAKDWGSLISLARQLRDFGTPVVGPGARPYRRSRLFAGLAEQLCGAVTDPQPDSMYQLERTLFHAIQNITAHARFDVFSHAGRVVIIRLLKVAKTFADKFGALSWLDHMSKATGDILTESELLTNEQAGLFYASVQEMKADMHRQRIDMNNLSIEDLGLFASPSKALRLSTIHYSKGREYGAVALIGLRQGSFPHFRATTPNAVAAEKRQFYVGVTRAERLLMYVAERDNWGNPPSPFLGPQGVGVI